VAPSRRGQGTTRGSGRPAPGAGRCTRPVTAAPPAGSARQTPRLTLPPDRGPKTERSCSHPFLPSGQTGQDLLEPLQGSDVTLARRRLAQAQGLGGFGVVQLLEVTQGQHLA